MTTCPAAAQSAPVGQVDYGVAVVSFTEDDAFFAGPYLRTALSGARGSARWIGDGTVIATPGLLSGAAAAAGAWRAGGRRSVLELDGEASMIFGTATRAARSVVAGARLERRVGARGGSWLRGAAHAAWRESGLLGGRGIHAGGWLNAHPRASVLARVERQWARGQLFDGDSRDRPLGTVPVRYTEAAMSLVLRPPFGELVLTGGSRHDRDAVQPVEALWGVHAVMRASTSAALVLAASREPPDFVRGGDGATAFTVALRWGRARALAAASPARTVPAGRAAVRVDEQRLLRVVAPGARTVEVSASFTDWEPVVLARAGDAFVLAVPLTTGPHRVLVRIDAGAWQVPHNVATVDDEYGGRVGLVLVP